MSLAETYIIIFRVTCNFCVSLIDVQQTDQDLEGTGLTDPLQQAALPDTGQNLLFIGEPEPSNIIPPAPQVAPPAPDQHAIPVPPDTQEIDEPIPEPLAQELTSKINL